MTSFDEHTNPTGQVASAVTPPAPRIWLRRPRGRGFDVALALGLLFVTWAQLFVAQVASRAMVHFSPDGLDVASGFHQRSVLVSLLLATICCLPLIWRRDRPLLILGIVALAQCATSLWTHDPLLTFAAPLVALYTVGRQVSTRRLVAATAATVLLLVTVNHFAPLAQQPRVIARPHPRTDITVTRVDESGTPHFFFENDPRVSVFALEFINTARGRTAISILQITSLLVAFAAVGRMTRLHKEYIAAAQQQAEEAERARAAEAARTAEEERLRIARELHDITAHSLAAIVVQAGAAESLAPTDPTATAAMLGQIRQTAKKSLDELRQVVGVLRTGQTGEDAPLTPQVSLRQLSELVDSFSATGLPLHSSLKEDGRAVADLPPATDIAAYRIVQESLTNALRHAASPTKTELLITLRPSELRIKVSNDGATEPEAKQDGESVQNNRHPMAQDGHGLAGMRERATALGGSFKATNDGAGTFTVEVALPL